MPNITPGRRVKICALGAIIIGLCGCTQMSKHSNMLVFGTNSSTGLKIGTDASQTPTIQLGINRQEVAFVPLLANTGDGDGLEPCKQKTDGTLPESCHYRATTDGKAKDSYSVLASFGSKASGKANEASASVAQYFATGIAAQLLAENGGANVITAGSNAEAIANATKATAEAKKAEHEATLAKANQNLDAATIAVRAILNDSSGNVTTAKRQALEEAMGGACGTDKLKAYDGKPIDDLLTYLNARRQGCMLTLGNKLTK